MNNFYKYILPYLYVWFYFFKSELSDDRISKIKSLIEKSKNYAQDFKLNDSNDSLYVLSDLRGKVVLINFGLHGADHVEWKFQILLNYMISIMIKVLKFLAWLSDSKEALNELC